MAITVTSIDSAAVNREKTNNKIGGGLTKEEALICACGDMELFKEIVALFLKEYPKSMSEIREAITTGSATMLDRSSHKLKGSIYNFGPHIAGEIALQLEVMGKGGDLSGAEESYSALVEEMASLKQAIVLLAEGKS